MLVSQTNHSPFPLFHPHPPPAFLFVRSVCPAARNFVNKWRASTPAVFLSVLGTMDIRFHGVLLGRVKTRQNIIRKTCTGTLGRLGSRLLTREFSSHTKWIAFLRFTDLLVNISINFESVKIQFDNTVIVFSYNHKHLDSTKRVQLHSNRCI